jgi:EKC/KEOPS complex subunit CGI121/TPRKB
MALETLQLSHLPATQEVHIALFQNVTNAEFLQQQLLSGNTDFEYAFIDASVVRSPPRCPLRYLFSSIYLPLQSRLQNLFRSRDLSSHPITQSTHRVDHMLTDSDPFKASCSQCGLPGYK